MLNQAKQELRDSTEFGWLIEDGNSKPSAPSYICITGRQSIDWTKDNVKALRFSRREDAQAFVRYALAGISSHRIALHGWG